MRRALIIELTIPVGRLVRGFAAEPIGPQVVWARAR